MERGEHVHRIAIHRDQQRLRVEGPDVGDRRGGAEIVDRSLSHPPVPWLHVGEQAPVILQRPDERVGAEIAGEVVRLLVLRHEDVGVGPQILVLRRGAALGCAHDEEVRRDGQDLGLLGWMARSRGRDAGGVV